MYTSDVARRRSVPGGKINPLLIISDFVLKSKNKVTNSGCNNTYQDNAKCHQVHSDSIYDTCIKII